MKKQIKNLIMMVTLTCVCLCMCKEPVMAATSVSGTFNIYKAYVRTVATKGANKADYYADAQIKPNNGSGAYTNYPSLYLVYKDMRNGADGDYARATNGTTCRSDELIYQQYLSGGISESPYRYYYLAGSMAPSATSDFTNFKYRITP